MCLTGTATDTIALNSFSLFTCTTVRYGQLLQEIFGMLAEDVQRDPIGIEKIKSSTYPPLSLSGLHGHYSTIILQPKKQTALESQ